MYDYSTLERVYVGAWMVTYGFYVKFCLASGICDLWKRDPEQWKLKGGSQSFGIQR